MSTNKQNIILFIAGSGGHKTQMERILKLVEHKLELQNIKKIGIFEKNYIIQNDMLEIFEVLPLRDKYSYIKSLINFPKIIFNQLYICFKLNKKYQVYGVISTGPGIAIIPSIIFKLFRKKIVFIETWSKFYKGSLSGRIIYKIADKFYLQNESLKKEYPKGIFGGKL